MGQRGNRAQKPNEELADHGTAKRWAQGCGCAECQDTSDYWRVLWKWATHVDQQAIARRKKKFGKEQQRRYREQRRKDRAALQSGEIEIEHGTSMSFNYYQCRCETCSPLAERRREQVRRSRAKKKSESSQDVVSPTGTNQREETFHMAQRVETLFTDDFDGTPAVETIVFGFEGAVYEVDVSEDNATWLRETFAPVIAVSRTIQKAPRKRSKGAKKSTKEVVEERMTNGSEG